MSLWTAILIIEAICALAIGALAWTAPQGWQSTKRGFVLGKPTADEWLNEGEE